VAFGAVHVHPKAKPRPQRHITSGATEEIKLDGYRALAVKSRTGRTLFSRRKKSFNRQFAHIVDALADLPEGTVVDGEVVALDDSGRPDFNLLQNFRAEASRIHYYIFDVLCWKDRDFKTIFRSLDDFLGRLVPFLKRLPKEHKFAVEIRNKDWLAPKLADVLREHGVALTLIDQGWMPRPWR
jgi:ATP-dependent DNA ligase